MYIDSFWRRDEQENHCHTFGDLHGETITTVSFSSLSLPPPPPFPSLPPSLPHQAHGMVNVWQWRAVGNDHGKTKQQQRSWQLEYSMMLNLHSRLSLWNTALALGMRNPIWKRWRCEIRGWLSAGDEMFQWTV